MSEMKKRRIYKDDKYASGSSFQSVQSLRDWINDEDLDPDWSCDIEGDEGAWIQISHYEEETDAAFAKRFNEEMEKKAKLEPIMKAQRLEQFLRLKEEFESEEKAK